MDDKQLLMHHDHDIVITIMTSSSNISNASTPPAASCSSDNSYVFFPLKLVFVIPINIFFLRKTKDTEEAGQARPPGTKIGCIYYGRSSVRPKNYAKRGRVQIY